MTRAPGTRFAFVESARTTFRVSTATFPLGRLTVITGVSGSGKSSLAFDTLYAEGQRRYVETFSAYTRQFLDRLDRPAAESIDGIPPAVAIDQSGTVRTSRSTVGTLTGVNDYLKLLYARFATGHCPQCEREVVREDTGAVLRALDALAADAFPVLAVAPVPLGGVGQPDWVRDTLRSQGFVRFLRAKDRGGDVVRIDDLDEQDLSGEFLDVVVDRLSARTSRARRSDSIAQAFRAGRGALRLVPLGTRGDVASTNASQILAFDEGFRCGACAVTLPTATPGLFSFNTPIGACERCRGFGRVIDVDWHCVVPDRRRSIRGGAIKPWSTASRRKWKTRCITACEARGVDVERPWEELSEADRHFVLEGGSGWVGVRGFFAKLEAKKYKMHVRVLLSRYRGYFSCPDCEGGRLRPEASCFRVAGKTLPEFWRLPVRESSALVEGLAKKQSLDRPVRLVVDEIASRLRYLESVGLGYLSLDRQSRTLSGGEVERVHLTAALGAALVDTLFVLDEPSVGLHARDNDRLLEILRQVRDRGNTVVVVEHDLDLLSAADHIVDMGPGSGREGGTVVVSGTVPDVAACDESLTGDYLAGRRWIEPSAPSPDVRSTPDVPANLPARRDASRSRSGSDDPRTIQVRGARENNLQGVDVDVPVDGLTVITGVSGSGKSSLVHDVIWRAYEWSKGTATDGEVRADSVTGFEHATEIVLVDQSPIGRTPRGNPATYTKIFDSIRKLFAATEDAKRAGLAASSFSFNVEGGRCPDCSGAGAQTVEMQFLSDVTMVCETCEGKRFRDEVLDVRYRGLNVHEVLDLTIREAVEFFCDVPNVTIWARLNFLEKLGLGYLELGQPINTLSGGEAQRLKLAGRAMRSWGYGGLLYLLDEPTTGLHLHDVAGLIEVFRDLVREGHGVVVIEHQLDVITAADHVIDLGPEGGDGGGRVVASGSPEVVRDHPESITGEWLRKHAARRPIATKSSPKSRRASASRKSAASARQEDVIRIVGARENNLRNIDVTIPRGRFVVVTGLSGAGKSSLVYDIVFAEGQRRYLDCLSPYARQFVEDLRRPDIDHLEGIPPSVAIEQRTTVGGRKSTVGTVTEIYHFLRLLYTRAGVQTCPDCDAEVIPRSFDDIRSRVRSLARGGGALLAPVLRGKKGFHSRVFASAYAKGYREARVDGSWREIPEEELRLERRVAHDIDIVVTRFDGGSVPTARLTAHLEAALEMGRGVVRFVESSGAEHILSRSRSCPQCDRDFDEPDPRNFSFHSRHGWCPRCQGYGAVTEPDPELLIEHWNLAIDDHPKGPLAVLDQKDYFPRGARKRFLKELLAVPGVPTDGRAVADWGVRATKTLISGHGRSGFEGLVAFVDGCLAEVHEDDREYFLADYGREVECPSCQGGRLASEWGAVRVADRTIRELTRHSIRDLRTALRDWAPETRLAPVVTPVLAEIEGRLAFLEHVGLDYVSLDRTVQTLSGGEAQRIRLAAQLGSNLRGACYILDEPTIGLHPRDNAKLLDTLRELRDHGNSVIVIEHDDATIEAADEIIDMGPGPGRHGGEIVAQGPLPAIVACERSATGEYFRTLRDRRVELASDDWSRRPAIEVRGATLHNLKDVDARFPIGALTVVTGVSGAGKSTLVRDVLEASVHREFRCLRGRVDGVRDVAGIDQLEGVREVDQMPIGRTPRSTPATYVGFWNHIRKIFAAVPEARARGYDARRFSFNTKGGRCEACGGQGRIRMEMDFLPDVTTECEICGGARFDSETLDIRYQGKNAAEVLAMSVEEALEFFGSYRELTRPLAAMDALGLGYLTLGQASTTLSGGEAQRVKLAVELAKTARGAWLYLFDEPTTGLHMNDASRLIEVLRDLASRGHAVVVIEHHLELIAGADWVIDLGPEGGEAGGQRLYQGPVAGIVKSKESATGECLREFVRDVTVRTNQVPKNPRRTVRPG